MARKSDFAHMSYCAVCKKNIEIKISRSPFAKSLLIVIPLITVFYAVFSVDVDVIVLGVLLIFLLLFFSKKKRICKYCKGSQLSRPRAEAKVEAEI